MSDRPKPNPPAGQDPEAFGSAYYERVYKTSDTRRFGRNWWPNRYYARLAERLARRAGGGRVLDVGCGQGGILAELRPWVEAWGVEVSEYAVARCRESAPRARVILGNVEEGLPPDLPRSGFEVLVARYLLEHLRRPDDGLARCAELLRPGGFLLYSVPNTASPGLRMKGKNWFGYGDPTHVSLLPPSEWIRLTRQAGLTIEKQFSDGLWDVPYVRGVPRLLQFGIFSLPTILAVLAVSTALPVSWGENLIVIARKP